MQVSQGIQTPLLITIAEPDSHQPCIQDFTTFLKGPIAHPIAEESDQGLSWKEVLEILMSILPKETVEVSHKIQDFNQDNDWSLNKILWYNKSRKKGRICPACLRLYTIGDDLAAHITGGFTAKDLTGLCRVERLALQQRKQELSGFCMSIFLK